jgi:hypothetical protein
MRHLAPARGQKNEAGRDGLEVRVRTVGESIPPGVRYRKTMGREVFVLGQIGAPKPSLGQAHPHVLDLAVASGVRHAATLGGVSAEFR